MSYTLGNGNITFPDGSVWSTSGASSASSNGYLKMPSGLIFQWMTAYTASGSSPNSTVTFPIAFPSACVCVIVDEGAASSWGTSTVTNYATNVPSTTGVSVNGVEVTTNNCYLYSGLAYKLFAIGY